MVSPQAASNTSSVDSELVSTTTQTGDELIYYTDRDVDPTLQQIVDLLKIDPFDLSSLAVKRVLPNRKFDNLFAFSPCELPISSRVRRECGPGLYEIWITHDKRIYKRIKLNISHTADPTASNQVQGNPPEKKHTRSRNRGQSRNREHSNPVTQTAQQNHAQPIIDAINLLKDLGVVAPQSSPAAAPEQSFDELLADRIATSKALGFERPEGGSAQLDEPSFFDSKFAGETLNMLASMAQSGMGLWERSILTRQDEVRVASGLAPIHLGGAAPPGQPEPAQPAHSPAQDQSAPAPDDMSPEQYLEQHLNFLVERAIDDSDPRVYADVTADLIDVALIKTRVLAPGALALVMQVKPSLKPHEPWFLEWLSALETAVEEIDEQAAAYEDVAETPLTENTRPAGDSADRNPSVTEHDKNTTREKDTKTPEAVPEKSGSHEKSEGKSKVGTGKPAQDKAPA